MSGATVAGAGRTVVVVLVVVLVGGGALVVESVVVEKVVDVGVEAATVVVAGGAVTGSIRGDVTSERHATNATKVASTRRDSRVDCDATSLSLASG